MKKTTVIICSLVILIICLIVLMGFMKLDKKESTTTTTTTEEVTSTTTSRIMEDPKEPRTPVTSIKTKEETPEPRTPVTSIRENEVDTTEVVNITETGIKCDDNNRLAWSNVMFAIEDNDLYIYLNDEDTKYKTNISDVNCISFERMNKSSFGTIKIYKDDNLKKTYSYSEMNQFTEDNIEDTFGKLEKVE